MRVYGLSYWVVWRSRHRLFRHGSAHGPRRLQVAGGEPWPASAVVTSYSYEPWSKLLIAGLDRDYVGSLLKAIKF